jgi:chromosome condensin MukBEF MukE localization factor
MESDRPKLRSEALPHKLAEVFRLLRKGRHICVEDGPNYRIVEQEEDRYRIVLDALGYELIHHAQGFYYIKGGKTFSSRGLQSITIFVFLLFQHLEDNKQGEPDHMWVRSLTTKRFVIDELPHFGTQQHRAMMANLELTRPTLHQRVLRVLDQLGMLEFIDDHSFRFRSPIYRFVDLCMAYAEEQGDEAISQADNQDERQIAEAFDDQSADDGSNSSKIEAAGDWTNDAPGETIA